MSHWYEQWHGAKMPSSVVEGGVQGGGSTSMSTGVALALSTKASLGHGHPQSDVTNLTSTLAALSAQISTKAAGAHTHPQSDVTNLESTLVALEAKISTKAAGTHTHAQADVTNLVSTLAALSAQISTKAAGTHTHAIADVTGLQSTLDLKAASTHVHGLATASTSGFAPVLPANSTTFLRSDLTWASPPAGGALAGAVPSTWATASTHILTGSTTMQSVTGLSFAISSAAMYRFEFICGWQTISSATGIAFGVNGPGSPLLIAYEWAASTGMGGLLTRYHNAFGAQQVAVPGSSAANIDNYGYCGGVVRTGANAGTLQLQFASEVAGSTVSVRAGSAGLLFGPL